MILYPLKRLRGAYPKNPKIPGKRPMGGKPLFRWNKDSAQSPFWSKKKRITSCSTQKRPPVFPWGNVRSNNSKWHARARKKAKNKRDESNRGKNVQIWKKTIMMLRNSWAKRLTPEQPGTGKGAKNGRGEPSKPCWTFDGSAIRSTEWPFNLPNTDCTESQRGDESIASWREIRREGKSAMLSTLGI